LSSSLLKHKHFFIACLYFFLKYFDLWYCVIALPLIEYHNLDLSALLCHTKGHLVDLIYLTKTSCYAIKLYASCHFCLLYHLFSFLLVDFLLWLFVPLVVSFNFGWTFPFFWIFNSDIMALCWIWLITKLSLLPS